MANNVTNFTINLTMAGPTNGGQVRQQILKELRGIKAPINIEVSPNTISQIQAVNKQLTNLNTQLKLVQTNAARATTSLGTLFSTFSSGSNRILDLERKMARGSTTMSNFTKSSKEASLSLNQFADQSGLAARRFLAFTVAATAIFSVINGIREGARNAVAFNKELIRISQVSNESNAQLNQLASQIRLVSTNYGVSATDLAKASVAIKAAGFNINETKAAVEALGQSMLSPNFGKLEDTVRGLIATVRQFSNEQRGMNLSMTNATEVIGVMNAVAADFAVEAQDIVHAVTRAGSSFATIARPGQQAIDTFKEFTAVFTSVRNSTQESAETIATGLRTIFARLQSRQVLDQLKNLGINLRFTRDEAAALGSIDLAEQFVGGYEAVERLSAALKDVNQASQEYSDVTELLGGQRQVGRTLAVLQETDARRRALATANFGVFSSLQAISNTEDSLIRKTNQLGQSFNNVFASIGNSEGIRTIAEKLLQLGNALVGVLNVVKPLIPLLITLGTIKIASFIPGFARDFGQRFIGTPAVKRNSGGIVPGVGNTDTVPANLPPGSYVIRKQSAQDIGYNNLSVMGFNQGGQIPVVLTPGEYIFPPERANKIGIGKLDRMNRDGIKGLNRGGRLSGTGTFVHRPESQLMQAAEKSYNNDLKLLYEATAQETLDRIPAGSSFLGSGVTAYAFKISKNRKIPQNQRGNVLRIQPKYGTSVIRNDDGTSLPEDVLRVSRPNIPTVLRPIESSHIYHPGNKNFDLMEELPYANILSSIGDYRSKRVLLGGQPYNVVADKDGKPLDISFNLIKESLNYGYTARDLHSGNIGLVNNKYKIVDPGGISRVTPEEARLILSDIRAMGFNSGGMVLGFPQKHSLTNYQRLRLTESQYKISKVIGQTRMDSLFPGGLSSGDKNEYIPFKAGYLDFGKIHKYEQLTGEDGFTPELAKLVGKAYDFRLGRRQFSGRYSRLDLQDGIPASVLGGESTAFAMRSLSGVQLPIDINKHGVMNAAFGRSFADAIRRNDFPEEMLRQIRGYNKGGRVGFNKGGRSQSDLEFEKAIQASVLEKLYSYKSLKLTPGVSVFQKDYGFDILYGSNNGEPVALASIKKDEKGLGIGSLVGDKSRGLLMSRGVLGVLNKARELGISRPTANNFFTNDSARLLKRFGYARGGLINGRIAANSGFSVNKDNVAKLLQEYSRKLGIPITELVKSVDIKNIIPNERPSVQQGSLGRISHNNDLQLSRSTIDSEEKLRFVLGHEIGHSIDRKVGGTGNFKELIKRQQKAQRKASAKAGFPQIKADYLLKDDESFANIIGNYLSGGSGKKLGYAGIKDKDVSGIITQLKNNIRNESSNLNLLPNINQEKFQPALGDFGVSNTASAFNTAGGSDSATGFFGYGGGKPPRKPPIVASGAGDSPEFNGKDIFKFRGDDIPLPIQRRVPTFKKTGPTAQKNPVTGKIEAIPSIPFTNNPQTTNIYGQGAVSYAPGATSSLNHIATALPVGVNPAANSTYIPLGRALNPPINFQPLQPPQPPSGPLLGRLAYASQNFTITDYINQERGKGKGNTALQNTEKQLYDLIKKKIAEENKGILKVELENRARTETQNLLQKSLELHKLRIRYESEVNDAVRLEALGSRKAANKARETATATYGAIQNLEQETLYRRDKRGNLVGVGINDKGQAAIGQQGYDPQRALGRSVIGSAIASIVLPYLGAAAQGFGGQVDAYGDNTVYRTGRIIGSGIGGAGVGAAIGLQLSSYEGLANSRIGKRISESSFGQAVGGATGAFPIIGAVVAGAFSLGKAFFDTQKEIRQAKLGAELQSLSRIIGVINKDFQERGSTEGSRADIRTRFAAASGLASQTSFDNIGRLESFRLQTARAAETGSILQSVIAPFSFLANTSAYETENLQDTTVEQRRNNPALLARYRQYQLNLSNEVSSQSLGELFSNEIRQNLNSGVTDINDIIRNISSNTTGLGRTAFENLIYRENPESARDENVARITRERLGNRQLAIVRAENSRINTERLISGFSLLSISAENAAAKFNKLSSTIENLASSVAGTGQQGQIRVDAGVLSRPGFDGYRETAQDLLRRFPGQTSGNFSEYVGLIDRVAGVLPEIVRNSISRSQSSNQASALSGRREYVTGQLNGLFGIDTQNPGTRIQQVLIDNIASAIGSPDFNVSSPVDVTRQVQEILQKQGGSEQLERIAKIEEQRLNALVSSLNQYNQLILNALDSINKAAEISQQRIKTEAEYRATAAGRPGEGIAFTTPAQYQQYLNNRLSGILQGTSLQNVNASTVRPQDIGQAYRNVNEEILRVQSRPGIPTRESTQELSRLQEQAARLNRAFSELGNISLRTADAQERLNRIQANREGLFNAARNFVLASPEERIEQQRGLFLLQDAYRSNGSLDNYSLENQQLILRTAQSFRDVTFENLGGLTGASIERRLLERSGYNFSPQTGPESQFQQQILGALNTAAEVERQRASIQTEAANNIVNQAQRTSNEFLSRFVQEVERFRVLFEQSVNPSSGSFNPNNPQQGYQDLIGQSPYNQIPRPLFTNLNQQGLQPMIDNLFGRSEPNQNIPWWRNPFGNAFGFSGGGVVPTYAQTGMAIPRGTDTVPAMLTPEEYVVNRKSAKKHRKLLDNINGDSSSLQNIQIFDSYFNNNVDNSQSDEIFNRQALRRQFSGYANGGIVYAAFGGLISAANPINTFHANHRRQGRLSQQQQRNATTVFIGGQIGNVQPGISTPFGVINANTNLPNLGFVGSNLGILGNAGGVNVLNQQGQAMLEGSGIPRERILELLGPDGLLDIFTTRAPRFAAQLGRIPSPGHASQVLLDVANTDTALYRFIEISAQNELLRRSQNQATVENNFTRGVLNQVSANPFGATALQFAIQSRGGGDAGLAAANQIYERGIQESITENQLLNNISFSAPNSRFGRLSGSIFQSQLSGNAAINNLQREQLNSTAQALGITEYRNRAIGNSLSRAFATSTRLAGQGEAFERFNPNSATNQFARIGATNRNNFAEFRRGQSNLSNIFPGQVWQRYNRRYEDAFTNPFSLFPNFSGPFSGTSPRRFAYGGLVTGQGTQDTVPAYLAPGEGVLSRQAVARLGIDNLNKANQPQTQAQTGQVPTFNFQPLVEALNNFTQNIKPLADVFAGFPEKINLEGRHTVEVIINGAQVLAELKPEIQAMIVQKTKDVIGQVFKEKLPDINAGDTLEKI